MDGLAEVYRGQDNTGGAIRFGDERTDFSGLQRAILAKREAQKPKPFDAQIGAAQLGKVWQPDREYFLKRYNDYLTKIKAYEFEKDAAKKQQLWKDLSMEEGRLAIDIAKSNADEANFKQTYDRMEKDNKFLYGDEDWKKIDAYATTPFEQRTELKITPASAVSAADYVYSKVKEPGMYDTLIEKDVNADKSATGTTRKRLNVTRLQEAVSQIITQMPENMRNAAVANIQSNPQLYAPILAGQVSLNDALAKTMMSYVLPHFGDYEAVYTKAAPVSSSGGGKSGNGVYTNDKLSAALVQTTDNVYETNLVPQGKTIKDMPEIKFEVPKGQDKKSGGITYGTIKASPVRIVKKDGKDYIQLSVPEQGDALGLKKVNTKYGDLVEVELNDFNKLQLTQNMDFDYDQFFDINHKYAQEDYHKRRAKANNAAVSTGTPAKTSAAPKKDWLKYKRK